MSIEGRIAEIFISQVPEDDEWKRGGAPMMAFTSARLVVGMGIQSEDGKVSDRYFDNVGAYSRTRPEVRQLSLITLDAIERANQGRDNPFLLEDTRRNIIISNMTAEELNSLLGRLIILGAVEVRGLELCTPCDRPDKLSGKKGFKIAFTNRRGESIGGLRVGVLSTGLISIGDLVRSVS